MVISLRGWVLTDPDPRRGRKSSRPRSSGTRALEPVVALRRRPAVWIAGLAAAALLVIGGLAWGPWQHDTRPAGQVVAQRVLDAGDAQRVKGSVDGSPATIVRSQSIGRAVLVTDHLPTPPAGKEYPLWLAFPGRGMVSAGLVPPGSGPTVTCLLHGDAGRATAAGITLEPSGGSVAPTSDPLALFSF